MGSQNKRPKTLYKYAGPAGRVTLTSENLAFKEPSELNDPFESNSSTPFFGKTLFPKLRPYAWDAELSKYGVSCFSEDPSSLLMWAHYGRSHTGLVIGFNPKDPSFQKLGKLVPITYSNDRPKTRKACDITPNLILAALSRKSEAWRYEREWRLISPKTECQHSGVFLTKPFDVRAITEIILGANAAPFLINKIAKWAREHRHIKLYRSRLNSLTYALVKDANVSGNATLAVSDTDLKLGEHVGIDIGANAGALFQTLHLAPDGVIVHDESEKILRQAIAMTKRQRKRKL